MIVRLVRAWWCASEVIARFVGDVVWWPARLVVVASVAMVAYGFGWCVTGAVVGETRGVW